MSGTRLAFIDLVLNLALTFIALFLLAFLYFNPVAQTGKIDPETQFMVVLRWPDESPVDVDLWIRGPDLTIVGFRSKDGRYMVLDRDDLGIANDTFEVNGEITIIRRNIETVTINAIVPGEYVVNLHYFGPPRTKGEAVFPIVEVIQVSPFALVATQDVPLAYREEKTALSFVVSDEGTISDVRTDIQMRLR